MTGFQIWLVSALASVTPVARVMHTAWGWPIAESLHFIGLSMLIGTVGLLICACSVSRAVSRSRRCTG